MAECECSLRGRLVGDGCEVCNPSLALEYAEERIADLEADHALTRGWGEAALMRLEEREKHIAELEKALREITILSDLAMADGDGARAIARKALGL